MMETAHDSVYLTTSVLPSPLSLSLSLYPSAYVCVCVCACTHTPSFTWSTTNLFLNQTSKLNTDLTRSFYLYLKISTNRKPAPFGSMVPFPLPYLKEKFPFFCDC